MQVGLFQQTFQELLIDRYWGQDNCLFSPLLISVETLYRCDWCAAVNGSVAKPL
jgi:hypothetical protein